MQKKTQPKKKRALQERLQKHYNKRTNKLNDYIEKLTYDLVKKNMMS